METSDLVNDLLSELAVVKSLLDRSCRMVLESGFRLWENGVPSWSAMLSLSDSCLEAFGQVDAMMSNLIENDDALPSSQG